MPRRRLQRASGIPNIRPSRDDRLAHTSGCTNVDLLELTRAKSRIDEIAARSLAFLVAFVAVVLGTSLICHAAGMRGASPFFLGLVEGITLRVGRMPALVAMFLLLASSAAALTANASTRAFVMRVVVSVMAGFLLAVFLGAWGGIQGISADEGGAWGRFFGMQLTALMSMPIALLLTAITAVLALFLVTDGCRRDFAASRLFGSEDRRATAAGMHAPAMGVAGGRVGEEGFLSGDADDVVALSATRRASVAESSEGVAVEESPTRSTFVPRAWIAQMFSRSGEAAAPAEFESGTAGEPGRGEDEEMKVRLLPRRDAPETQPEAATPENGPRARRNTLSELALEFDRAESTGTPVRGAHRTQAPREGAPTFENAPPPLFSASHESTTSSGDSFPAAPYGAPNPGPSSLWPSEVPVESSQAETAQGPAHVAGRADLDLALPLSRTAAGHPDGPLAGYSASPEVPTASTASRGGVDDGGEQAASAGVAEGLDPAAAEREFGAGLDDTVVRGADAADPANVGGWSSASAGVDAREREEPGIEGGAEGALGSSFREDSEPLAPADLEEDLPRTIPRDLGERHGGEFLTGAVTWEVAPAFEDPSALAASPALEAPEAPETPEASSEGEDGDASLSRDHAGAGAAEPAPIDADAAPTSSDQSLGMNEVGPAASAAEPAQEDASGGSALLGRAAHLVITESRASISFLQRRLEIGFGEAQHLIEQLERAGVVGPYRGNPSRDILLTLPDWESRASG